MSTELLNQPQLTKKRNKTTLLDLQTNFAKYYPFLLQKCIRKDDSSYLMWPIKMNLALLFTRFGIQGANPFVDGILKLDQPIERVKILMHSYTFFRFADDIADGEFGDGTPQERLDYIVARSEAMKLSSWDEVNAIDRKWAKALNLAKKIGKEEELRECYMRIYDSLGFDAKRVNDFSKTWKRIFFPRDQLIDYYFRRDTLGTGQAMMYIFGNNPDEVSPETLKKCVDFSDAVRISYTLRDLIEDIRIWIVNISEEDAQFFGISTAEVDALARHGYIAGASQGIRNWIYSEIEVAKQLLQNSIDLLHNYELTDLARISLDHNYLADFQKDISGVEKALGSFELTPNTYIWAYLEWRDFLVQMFHEYRDEMSMSPEESKKFFSKCKNLFLCYLGFSSQNTSEEAHGAAVSAFLSAYYDWVTDGPRPTPEARDKFTSVLKTLSNKEEANEMVLDMLQKDVTKNLSEDWLERGATSFIFILEMMWLRSEYDKKSDTWEVGLMLQVIDDIDDYEQDKKDGDWNVFCTERARQYYERMEACFPDNGKSIFPGAILPWFIGRMRKKAKKILGLE